MSDERTKKVATGAACTCKPRGSQPDESADLVASQVKFGLTYAREARDAYQRGKLSYGELAQSIAMNACAAAVRFAGELRDDLPPELLAQIEALELDLVHLLDPRKADLRSTA